MIMSRAVMDALITGRGPSGRCASQTRQLFISCKRLSKFELIDRFRIADHHAALLGLHREYGGSVHDLSREAQLRCKLNALFFLVINFFSEGRGVSCRAGSEQSCGFSLCLFIWNGKLVRLKIG